MGSPVSRSASTGFFLAGAAAVLFACKGLLAKALSARGVDYITLSTVRNLLALPLFAGLALWRGVNLRQAPRAAIGVALLAGALGYGMGALVDFRALELIDVAVERALLFTYPAMVVAWQAIARRSLPRPAVLAALVATYGGIVLVVGALDGGLWRQNLLGALLVLTCAAGMTCYFVLGERSIVRLGSSAFTLTGMLGAAAFALLAFFLARPVAVIATLDIGDWLLLLLIAGPCMFLPILFQAGAIQRIGAERGALASTIGPPAALLLGVMLLGERPGFWQLAGTALIVGGILLIARKGTAA